MEVFNNFSLFKIAYSQLLGPIREKYELTKIELDILLFIAEYPQYDSARDIIKYRKLTKSHVSMALHHLEKKGYIIKEFRMDNKKQAHIVIQDSAKQIIEEGIQKQREFEEALLKGFTKEEIDLFYSFYQRVCSNIQEDLIC